MITESVGGATSAVELTNQWNDFLLRELDPYAMAKYNILLEWLGDITGKTCLVVGSGSGEFAALLALRGAEVTAVDIDSESVALTEKTAIRLGAKLKTQVGRIENLSLERTYDLVAATDVLEHIEDDKGAAQKLIQLTRSQGTLLITVPALQSLFGLHDEVLHHFRRYTVGQLRSLFEKTTRIEKSRYFGFFLIPIALLFSRILRRPYPVAEIGQAEKKGTFAGLILRKLLSFEGTVALPLGTSVLLVARRT